ncbi:hypothetical protein THIOKS11930001 [Thiocapsa sp. KS1]|nr:hypothetical protein THIOKS11930001 [Thiocapsa sp. KS1]
MKQRCSRARRGEEIDPVDGGRVYRNCMELERPAHPARNLGPLSSSRILPFISHFLEILT